MYEQPKLNPVGDARDVILGITTCGDDIDGNYVCYPFDFAPEVDTDEL
jgi:hypothetical protein